MVELVADDVVMIVGCFEILGVLLFSFAACIVCCWMFLFMDESAGILLLVFHVYAWADFSKLLLSSLAPRLLVVVLPCVLEAIACWNWCCLFDDAAKSAGVLICCCSMSSLVHLLMLSDLMLPTC